MFGTNELSGLIGDIYDCALAPSRWQPTLARVAAALYCERAILSLNDLRRECVLIGESVGWEPHWLAERDRHAPEIHAVLGHWLAGRGEDDEPFVASRDLPPEQASRSAYVRECLAPQGIGDVVHFFLLRNHLHFSECVLARQASAGPFVPDDIALGKLLLPHLRRAVTISRVLDARDIERGRMAQVLDALRCGVMLTDANGAIVHANRAAEHMLREGGRLDGTRGALKATRLAANRELQQAIRQGARDETALGAAGTAIRLSAQGECPVFAHVLPLAGGSVRSHLQPEAIAAVFVGAPADEREHIDGFAQAMGLTPAETRLVAVLVSGRTLTESARLLGVGRATAKTQLESVYRKTGASRQGELIRLVLQSLPAG